MGRFLLAWMMALAFAASPAIASAAPLACCGHPGKPMAMTGHGSTTSRAPARVAAKAPCDSGGLNGCAGSCHAAIVAIASAAYRLPRVETRALVAPLVGLASSSRAPTGLDPPPKTIV